MRWTNGSSGQERPPIQLTPDPITGEYRYSPQRSDPFSNTPQTPKKPAKALRYIAAGLVVSVISALSGGGAAYYVLSNYQAPPALSGSASSNSLMQAPFSMDSTPNTANTASAGTIADVVNRVSSSVVEISIEITTGNPFFGMQATEGSGSGVVLTADGYIVTNNHVVAGANAITVRRSDGTEHAALVVGTDPKTDLAVIKIDATGLNPVLLADSSQIQVGEAAIAIGNPLGTLGGTVTTGIISAKDREITIDNETMTLLQTSAAVNPGNSGGGLFNMAGELMGIVNAKSSGNNVEGLGFAIPSNLVRDVTRDIIEKGYVSGRPEIGISVQEIMDAQSAFAYRVNELGVYVASTTRDNGLEVGDRLITVDDVEIERAGDIQAVLNNHAAGDSIDIVVKRAGKQLEVSVTLAEQIPEALRQVPIAA